MIAEVLFKMPSLYRGLRFTGYWISVSSTFTIETYNVTNNDRTSETNIISESL